MRNGLNTPLLIAVVRETPVQRALRQALERLHDVGVRRFVSEQPSGRIYRLIVCDLAAWPHAPALQAFSAMRPILDALARGSGFAEAPVGLEHGETLETIMIYLDARDFSDAQACAFIQDACRRVAGTSWLRPKAPAVILLN